MLTYQEACAKGEHNWVDVTCMNDPELINLCLGCGKRRYAAFRPFSIADDLSLEFAMPITWHDQSTLTDSPAPERTP